MGGGSYSASSFATYSASVGKSYDVRTNRISGQTFEATQLKEILNPKGKIRECCNSEEHRNSCFGCYGFNGSSLQRNSRGSFSDYENTL